MWANKFEHYRATEIPKTNIRAENYNEKRFPINKQIATFCIYDADTDDIIAFNSVFKPVHWPETVARIFNRSYYDPAYRQRSLRKSHEPGWGQKYSYDLMIQACKENGIKVATVTRENTGKINSINSMHKSLLHADTNWKLLDDYYLGYDAPKNQSCWYHCPKIFFLASQIILCPRLDVNLGPLCHRKGRKWPRKNKKNDL